MFKRIKELRLEYGFTQKEVAAALGISINCYRRKEKGMSTLHACDLLKLSSFYHISSDYIVDLSNCRQPKQ